MIKLEQNETVVLQVRKHWFVMFARALTYVAVAFLPFVLFDLVKVGTEFKAFFYAVWLLILWLILALEWTDYYLDVWYLTDKRIVDVEQKGLFHRDEAIVRLEAIQDINIVTPGILATFFGYGDIVIQSAGASREFIIRHAASPDLVKDKIFSLQAAVLEKPEAATVIN